MKRGMLFLLAIACTLSFSLATVAKGKKKLPREVKLDLQIKSVDIGAFKDLSDGTTTLNIKDLTKEQKAAIEAVYPGFATCLTSKGVVNIEINKVDKSKFIIEGVLELSEEHWGVCN